MNFAQRTEAFWAWFADNEALLADMVADNAKYGTEKIVALIDEGVGLLAEDVHYNMGGDHEFTFTVDGADYKFYLYPYVVSRMPAQFAKKWKFFPCAQGSGDQATSFAMYGTKTSMKDMMVSAELDNERGKFIIEFFSADIAALDEDKQYNMFFIMMELCIGEGFAKAYVGDVRRAATKAPGMMPLTQLRDYMKETLFHAGKVVVTDPVQGYSSYRFNPQPNAALRRDIITGSTRYTRLLEEYYCDETLQLDALAAYGAKAAFLLFAMAEDADRGAALQQRYAVEDILEQEVLGAAGSGREIGALLGGAAGTQFMYTDLILYDEEEFLRRARQALQKYPQRFYLASFAPNAPLVPLFDE